MVKTDHAACAGGYRTRQLFPLPVHGVVWTTSSGLLYSKQAFVHWYVSEGMEEGEFSEAHEDTGFCMFGRGIGTFGGGPGYLVTMYPATLL